MPRINIRINGKKHNIFGKKASAAKYKQCFALYEWQSNNVSMLIGTSRKFMLDSIVSNDNSMFRMFGKTYDNWTLDDATAYKKMFTECKKQLSKSAKTYAYKLLNTSSNRKALKSLNTGYVKKKYNSRRQMTGYERYTNAWLLNFYSIASARAANSYAFLKVKNTLNITPNDKYAKTIKVIRDNKGIIQFLSKANKISYIQQLGGSTDDIVEIQDTNRQNSTNQRNNFVKRTRISSKCGSGKCGDKKNGEAKLNKLSNNRKKITNQPKESKISRNSLSVSNINSKELKLKALNIKKINTACIAGKEACDRKCNEFPWYCPGGADAAYKRGIWQSCSNRNWKGEKCVEAKNIYGRLDQNNPFIIPSKYKDLYNTLKKGASFKMTEENLVVVSGIGDVLIKKCEFLTGKRKTIAGEFIKSGIILSTMGNTYMDINLAKNIKLAALLRTGVIIGENLACRLPESYILATNMVKSIEEGRKKASVDNTRFINTCANIYRTSQCECLAKLGQSVIPNIRQFAYDRDIIQRIMRGNPLVALAIPFKCGINKY